MRTRMRMCAYGTGPELSGFTKKWRATTTNAGVRRVLDGNLARYTSIEGLWLLKLQLSHLQSNEYQNPRNFLKTTGIL